MVLCKVSGAHGRSHRMKVRRFATLPGKFPSRCNPAISSSVIPKSEIVLRFITTNIGEWQHNDGRPGGQVVNADRWIRRRLFPGHKEIRSRESQYADNYVVEPVARSSSDRSRLGISGLSSNAFRCQFEGPGQNQGNRETGRREIAAALETPTREPQCCSGGHRPPA